MLGKVTDRLYKWLVANCGRSPSDEVAEIYRYGLECLLADLLQLSIIVLIALSLSNIFATAAFALFFTALKRHTGGYHAPNHLRCILGFTCICISAVLLAPKVPESWTKLTAIVCAVVSLACVIAFAPVEGYINPKSEMEMHSSRQKSIVIAILQALFILASIYLIPSMSAIWLSASFGVLAVAVTMVIPNRKEREHSA